MARLRESCISLNWAISFALSQHPERGTQEQAAKFHAARQYLRYRTVYEKIEETGECKSICRLLYGSANYQI